MSLTNTTCTFILSKKYDKVFVYGTEINDFHSIDKARIFALHHSAIQEIDNKINKLDSDKITSHTVSDERLLQNIEVIDTSIALKNIVDIPVKKYNYIDSEKNTMNKYIGFVSDDVNAILQDSNELLKEYQPNIMQSYNNINFKDINNGLYEIELPYHNSLDIDTDVLLILTNNDNNFKYKIKTKIISLRNGKCVFNVNHKADNVILYGTLLSDVKSFNKDDIYTYHHGAIQELNKVINQKDSEIKELQTKTTLLEDENSKLKSRLDAIEKHLGSHFFE